MTGLHTDCPPGDRLDKGQEGRKNEESKQGESLCERVYQTHERQDKKNLPRTRSLYSVLIFFFCFYIFRNFKVNWTLPRKTRNITGWWHIMFFDMQKKIRLNHHPIKIYAFNVGMCIKFRWICPTSLMRECIISAISHFRLLHLHQIPLKDKNLIKFRYTYF